MLNEVVNAMPQENTNNTDFTAIIPAAGYSTRMNGKNKLLEKLKRKPIVWHTLQTFQNCPRIREIIIVTNEENHKAIKRLIKRYKIDKVRDIIPGGKDRMTSVFNGLMEVETKYVAVHDGARPLLSHILLNRLLDEMEDGYFVVPGIPVKETIKVVGDDCYIVETPPRHRLYRIQTPQVFETQPLFEAYVGAMKTELEATDEATLMEALGHRVKVILGERRNVKITTPEDLDIAKIYMKPSYQEGEE